MLFDFKIVGWFDVADALTTASAEGAWPDSQHRAALKEGYPFCYRLVAVGPGGDVYAVWEVYSKAVGNLASSKSRTIHVDADWNGQGLAPPLLRQSLPIIRFNGADSFRRQAPSSRTVWNSLLLLSLLHDWT
jgi:hypothetical protein